jgi:hypothetical protein
MSTYGRLQIRRSDGSLAPLPGEVVLVQIKRSGETAWNSIAGMRTTSTGYYYTNWNVPHEAGETFSVAVAYVTTLPQATSTSRVLQTYTVQ